MATYLNGVLQGSSVDPDIVTGNIKAGINILGVTGKTEVVDTTSGTAIASEILTTKVAYVDGIELTGNMPNVSADITPTGGAILIPAGYHDGTKVVTADANLVTGNVKAEVNIYGVVGKTEVVDTTTATPITAGGVLTGTDGFVNGSSINGTMPDNAGDNANIGTDIDTPTVLKLLAPEGYYDGANDYVTIIDANFVAASIVTGVNLFGIEGAG